MENFIDVPYIKQIPQDSHVKKSAMGKVESTGKATVCFIRALYL